MDKDFKKQEERIKKVFHLRKEKIDKNIDTLTIYLEFINNNLDYPVKLTGIEDFIWEEFYVLGPGKAKEYEIFKKTNPSYTDIFNLESIDDEFDDHLGLIANVKRDSDNKTFQIPLADLKGTEIDSKNYQILDDYSVWCVNY